jgi:hypothetical protein
MYRWVAALLVVLLFVGTVATLSGEEVFCARGLGSGADADPDCGVDVPEFAGCESTPVSEANLEASFVENIRMSRFAMDGFSDAAPGIGWRCGSKGEGVPPTGTEAVDSGCGAAILSGTGR